MIATNRFAAVLLLAGALAACSDLPTGAAASAEHAAAAMNYPAPVLSVTNSGGYPLISWSALTGATSYTVTQVIIETATNRQTTESNSWRYETLLGSTTGTSFLDTSNAHTGKSVCSYTNYPMVYRYTYRYEVTATFSGGTSMSSIFAPIAPC